MVHPCCVPNCKSNYKPGENISTFGFPKSETKKQEWLSAIKREKTYKVTKHSRVCIKHFHESDIERETVYTDPRTGITYRAPIKYPRLVKDAVPKILPNCPQYLTKTDSKRESAEERRIRIENEQLTQVIAESEKSHEEYNQEKSFSNFQEFLKCFENRKNSIDNIAEWDIVYKPNAVLFLLLESSVPKIKYAVTLNDECNIRVYNDGVELNFEDFFVNSGVAKLSKITNLNELGVILNHVFNVSSNKEKASEVAVCVNAINKLFIKLHELVHDDQVKSVELLQEQWYQKIIRFLKNKRKSEEKYEKDPEINRKIRKK